MQRSAVSIPSNIAEGNDRNTSKEYLRFLYIARWSCSELKTQVYIAESFLSEEEFKRIMNDIIIVHKMLNGLIKTIASNIKLLTCS
jgi:four helix bundle protein